MLLDSLDFLTSISATSCSHKPFSAVEWEVFQGSQSLRLSVNPVELCSQTQNTFLKQIIHIFEHLLDRFFFVCFSQWVYTKWVFHFLVSTFFTILAISRSLYPRNPKPNLFPICTTSLIFHSSETQCRASSHSTLSGFVLQLWSLNVSV